MIRVLIADDHAIVRQGLRRLFEEDGGLRIVAEAESGDALLVCAREHPADIVVMDLSMPGRNGLDLIADLHAEFPSLPILVLSMHPEEHYALRAMQAGARGYLPKSSAADLVLDAIRRVIAGRRYITPSLADQLVDDLTSKDPPATHLSLSNREFQVLIGLASGHSVTELAADMHLSFKTISTYRTRLLAKLHLHTNADLTTYALEHNLL